MNKHLRNTLWIYVTTLLVMPITYAIKVLYARELSLADFGLFFGLFGFFNMFNFLRDWGMGGGGSVNYFANKYMVEKRYDKVKTLFWFNQAVHVGLSIVIVTILLLLKNYILGWLYPNEEHIAQIFPLFAIFWITITITSVGDNFLTILQNQKINGLLKILNYGVILASSLILMWVGTADYMIPLFAYFLGNAALIIAYFILFGLYYGKYVYKPKFYLGKDLFTEVFHYSNALVIAGVAGTMFFATDKVIVQYFEGAENVAIYVVGVATAALMALFTDPLKKVLTPVAAKLWHGQHRDDVGSLISTVFNNYLMLVLPLVLCFVVFADNFVLAVYGEKFLPAVPIIWVLNLAGMIISFNPFATLGSLDNPRVRSRSAVIAGVFNVTVSIILIQYIGILGAALGTLTAALIRFLILSYYARKYVSIKLDPINNIKILMAAAVFLATGLLLKATMYYVYTDVVIINFLLNGTLILGLAGLVYLAMLWLLRVINKEKIGYLVGLFIKR